MFVVLLFSFLLNISVYGSDEISKLKAVKLLETGKYQDAIYLLQQIKSADPEILYLQGLSYSKLDKNKEAVEYFKRFDALKTNNKEFYYYYAVSLFEIQNYQAALEQFRKSELLGVKMEESTYYSGYIYMNIDDYEKAFPYFIRTIKEKGNYALLAHYYAGVCLYKQGIDNPETLSAALYHFEKAIASTEVISKEAARYIDVINEYSKNGVTRYKKRWHLNAQANLLFSNNRGINPFDGIINLGIASENWTILGDLKFKGAFSPLMFKNFGFFINYGFSTNLAFSTGLTHTNTQEHLLGASIQYFSSLRTFEAVLEYYYSIMLLDQDSLRKLAGANVISLGVDTSLTRTWVLGFKMPVMLYNGIGGVWGDFTGRSIEILLTSYHLIGAASFKIEPSLLMFSSADNPQMDYKYYNVGVKLNIPWHIMFFYPSIKSRVGYIIEAVEPKKLAYDAGLVLFVPLGLGMKGTYSVILKRGFISDNYEFLTGIGFEYVF